MIKKGPGRVTMAEAISGMEEVYTPKSSNILGMRYYPQQKVLQVQFKNAKGELTGTYDHANVTPDFWQRFKGAESHGKFYNEHFRNSKNFPVKRVA